MTSVMGLEVMISCESSTGWSEMKLDMIEDEFDKYFALAKEAAENDANANDPLRRGSLPTTQLLLPGDHYEGGGGGGGSVRRTASCKLPARRHRSSSRGHSPRNASNSPSRRPSTINLENENSYVHETTLRAPSPGPGFRCHSAPHSRSSSWKKGKRPSKSGAGGGGGDEEGEPRPRTGSVPLEETVCAQLERIKLLQTEDFCPVRNFSTTSKGLVNRGDSFKRKSIAGSLLDNGSPKPKPRSPAVTPKRPPSQKLSKRVSGGSATGAAADGPVYKVLVLGAHGVGKTALLQQFLTSEYMGAAVDRETVFDDENEVTISVLLDGEETTMDFIDLQYEESHREVTDVDAYVIVYSLTDRETFQKAGTLAHAIRREDDRPEAIILVANKSELVRTRMVSEDDGKDLCNMYEAKYIEVSAALNHRVDNLLVGIAKQIQLNPKRLERRRKLRGEGGAKDMNSLAKSAKGLLDKFFKKQQPVSKSCDNLHVL